ncbi:hypothetical protein H6G89_08675 [Oscillatoria sp. FACHB-1407]|uniref:PIN domain-containing protein n=1 Tax=Oscillatoria sp. FACHB-1407 TaxID=2692847 RepID=UPI001687F72F|nr:PIN domain-containing protein [Oscillatoria sp. FACHB-1407]MBD2461115.1 hypothetical protein [Oscillatoria sp. FACHB-1407]
MAAIPPVILVLDIGALSAATPREWLEFSRVGSCIVPQVVYEEMKFLFDRSPDPDLERIARAFNRFYATSGWQISEATAHHAVLKSGAGQALTRRTRISLAVGKCAYALSQEFPASLVVLVSSDRSMLQRIYDIQANNLCAITGPALLQWCRTGQRPIAVSQKLQRLRVATGAQVNSTIQGQAYTATSPSRITTTPTRTTSTTRITSGKKTTIQEASSMPSWIPQAFSLATSLAALIIAGFILVNVFRSANFQQLVNPSDAAPTQTSP